MKKIVISFLGKARKDTGGKYRSLCYRFADGQKVTTRFFGLSLAQQLRPDLFILLGTCGSMWDVLFDGVGDGDEMEEDRLALMEEVEVNSVSQGCLDRLAPLLERQLGMACRSLIIPFGRDVGEQMEILATMAEEVAAGDTVSMDLTHGFRHLPMLGFLSAMFLKEVKRARVEGLYYGAADMQEDGEAPVVALDGLLNLADWIGALGRYDQGGDYGVFAPLLRREREAVSQIDLLEEAAFFERVGNSSLARKKLDTFHEYFSQEPSGGYSPAVRLFRKPLEARLSWRRREPQWAREGMLARQYLQRGDFLRAVIFGYESHVTRRIMEEKLGDAGNYEVRKGAGDDLRTRFPMFEELAKLRNALAHGIRPSQQEVDVALASRSVLERKLNKIFKELGIGGE
ncbi:MAG: TIGR02221 family CRISPR-associated protein [Magnetococcales bacterium]|nr:TIGR02221 family CRISPR-associated protein [Magnetococcales bacterium]